MKTKFLIVFLFFLLLSVGTSLFSQPAEAYVRVRGYYKSNGTYVRPHVRSNPNSLRYDNYSYKGGSRYNRSYYSPRKNYSSDWNTPSYITDPEYYEGKSIYDSNN